eukprot:TRINITY_DN1146_c0_g1_i1.p1 TRINITY_DN1146_c0_g1~~TRINITY_DN1146_c0_g1_i1.p1  ORF type:complete len:544 (-),score=160.34 TRINITY_DN1146_c0_g1_i1:89-1720(-)
MGLNEILFIDVSNPDIGIVQVLFLMFVYGYILSQSSALISDGSELLLLIPSLAGIVGSVVLPVLGAVPDGAIVLFSGMGPPEEVDESISVGVGALAGSTIMLLTIPWALCIISGRVDIVNGEAHYKGKPKLTQGWHHTNTGVTPRPSVAVNAKIMIGTAISYVIIQIAAFSSHCGTNNGCVASHEHWVALVALLISIACFCGYLWYNIKNADSEDNEDFIGEVKKQAIESHMLSISAAFESDLKTKYGEGDKLKSDDTQFKSALKSFFSKYDRDGNGVIDAYELRVLLDDLNEDMSEERFATFLKEIDTDNSGTVSFKEFEVAMKEYIRRKNEHSSQGIPMSIQTHHTTETEAGKNEGEVEEEEEEEEEMPEDIASLPAHQQKLRILLRSAWMMGLGTLIVLLFSDPMVDVLNEVGHRFHINPFYVAFILAPVASNASELIASIAYATKKTKKTITISLAALEGAACMNNTFCLGIFLLLIFSKNLAWKFSAETISILFVELALFGVGAFIRTQRLWLSGVIISLYPISIFLVWFLENVLGLN